MSFAEHLDHIRQEHETLQASVTTLKQEIERSRTEKAECQQQSRTYYETAYWLNIQIHKQAEINARLQQIITDAIPHLPAQHQNNVKEAIENAQRVTAADIERRIRNQQACNFPFSTDLFSSTPTAETSQQPARKKSKQETEATSTLTSAKPTTERRTRRSSIDQTAADATKRPTTRATAKQAAAGSMLATLAAAITGNDKDADATANDEVDAEGEAEPEEGEKVIDDSGNDGSAVMGAPVKDEDLKEESGRTDSRASAGSAEEAADDDAENRLQMDIDSEKPEHGKDITSPTEGKEATDSKTRISTTETHSEAIDALLKETSSAPRPKQIKPVATLPHSFSVSALTFNNSGSRVYTGGKGYIQMWDNTHESEESDSATPKAVVKPLMEFQCLNDSYIRSCKLTADERRMVLCGETKEIVVYDIETGTPTFKEKMETNVPFHYALTLSQDSRYCFSCFSDGDVGMWDLHNGELVRRFSGHRDSVSCIDIDGHDGKYLVTGSLDRTVRVWDWAANAEVCQFEMPSQVFTLGASPTSDAWIAVGLESSAVEVVNIRLPREPSYQLRVHDSSVLSLKFAPSGSWFITGGKDKLLNVWKAPYGPSTAQVREPNSILCCDIAATNQYIGTGSWEKSATIYKTIFE